MIPEKFNDVQSIGNILTLFLKGGAHPNYDM
jgi:hypothetical protein